jgi:hypothetical protein
MLCKDCLRAWGVGTSLITAPSIDVTSYDRSNLSRISYKHKAVSHRRQLLKTSVRQLIRFIKNQTSEVIMTGLVKT